MLETITITKSEYQDLVDQAFWAQCLDAAGVDNWDGGFENAREEYIEWKEQQLKSQAEEKNKGASSPNIVNLPPLFYLKTWLRNTFIDAIKNGENIPHEALRNYLRALEDTKIMIDYYEKGGTDVNPGRGEHHA